MNNSEFLLHVRFRYTSFVLSYYYLYWFLQMQFDCSRRRVLCFYSGKNLRSIDLRKKVKRTFIHLLVIVIYRCTRYILLCEFSGLGV